MQSQQKREKNIKVLDPPTDFEKQYHKCKANSELTKFSCNNCEEHFPNELLAKKHMEKMKKDKWNNCLKEIIKDDERLSDWYRSPADCKNLTPKKDLPNSATLKDITNSPKVVNSFTNKEKIRGDLLQHELNKERAQNKLLNDNLSRQVKLEVKKKLQETGKETIEILSTDGNIIKARNIKVIIEENTGNYFKGTERSK